MHSSTTCYDGDEVDLEIQGRDDKRTAKALVAAKELVRA